MDHRAAGGACLPGGVHHQVGGPLVGNDHDQIVGNLPFHSNFSLLFMQQIFLGGGSADAVHRHSHQNALAGHIQPQVTGRLAHQPRGPGGHAEQHGLLRGLQAQKVQHLRGGGALTQGCQHQRDPVGPEPGGELLCPAAVSDGDEQIDALHGGLSSLYDVGRTAHSSMISSSTGAGGVS